jgi:hypothetical protein
MPFSIVGIGTTPPFSFLCLSSLCVASRSFFKKLVFLLILATVYARHLLWFSLCICYKSSVSDWQIFCLAYRYLFAEAGAGRHAQAQADHGVQRGDHGEEEPALIQQHFPVLEIRDIFGTDPDP